MRKGEWLVTICDGIAFIYQRNYWLGLIPVPWALQRRYYHYSIRAVDEPDLVDAAIQYIEDRDPDGSILIKLRPWSKS